MQEWLELARAKTAAGDELVLRERAGVYEIRCNGWDLMSNRAHASEEAMARLALAAIGGRVAPKILVGGLGMGFTLRAALDAAPADAQIEVVEFLPEIVAWNRGPLAGLAGRPLDDARATVRTGDAVAALAAGQRRWDAILLDIDNGPGAIMLAANARLYAPAGIAQARAALAPGGALAIWSADRAAAFEGMLTATGCGWRVVETEAAPGRAPRHAIYLLR